MRFPTKAAAHHASSSTPAQPDPTHKTNTLPPNAAPGAAGPWRARADRARDPGAWGGGAHGGARAAGEPRHGHADVPGVHAADWWWWWWWWSGEGLLTCICMEQHCMRRMHAGLHCVRPPPPLSFPMQMAAGSCIDEVTEADRVYLSDTYKREVRRGAELRRQRYGGS